MTDNDSCLLTAGYAIDRAMVRQKKTGRQVKFELTDQTRQAVDDYLRASGKKSGEFLFTSRRRTDSCMTTRLVASGSIRGCSGRIR